MAKVLIKDLNKKYDDVHAVKNVNLEIRDREFVVLVGPSGCGKTTTLRMVAGLEDITSGEISIDGRVVNDLAPMDRDIAMVFQNYALYPHMSVQDNMAFGLKMRKFERADIERRVRQAAEILGIQALLARKPRQLSGGQRQRVALGRAIVRNPRVFLHERLETTAIYVTHDQIEAMTLGDRVVVMKDGVVQQEGAPLTLYQRPANRFVASFIGSPAMNFVDVNISGDGLWAEAQGLRLQVPQRMRSLGGQRLTLGVRPEALRLANGADEHGFATTVDVLEPLGNEILLNFRAGGVQMVARVDPGVRVKAHESVRLALDPQRLHFFDPKTEAAI